MAILHGNWLAQDHCFFVWGETWRHLETAKVQSERIPSHPYGMTPDELIGFLKSSTRRSEQTGKPEPLFQVPSAVFQAANPTVNKTAGRQRAVRPVTPPSSTQFGCWRSQVVALPTHYQPDTFLPQLSNAADLAESDLTHSALFLWQVEGFQLSAAETLTFLRACRWGQLC
ncbi:MAG: hypothetical protein HC886_08215 [Leptolyngbyaceae cyanobacterium SM1_1_3]|nr:hypothetical protein [Leptolyngbyaceae cyanobacterium SM1_1_3]